MNIRRHSVLVLASLILPASAAEQPAGSAAKRPAAARSGLFIGSGTAGWLPKAALLPTSEELELKAQKLSSRLRNVDPFGLPTFPKEEDAKITPAPLARPTSRPTLNQALQTVRVTGINLESKEFLVGGRNLFEGDVLRLEFQNEIFNARVTSVEGTQIVFRDLERNETGVLTHTLLPHLKFEPAGSRTRMTRFAEKLSPQQSPNRHPTKP